MSAAVSDLEKIRDIHVISCEYETMSTPGREHIRTTVRTVTIETEDVELIPYYIKWTYLGYSGKAFVTCKGRAPKCLKCQLTGHLKRDCTTEQCPVCKQWGHNDPNCTNKISWARKVGPVENTDMEYEFHLGDGDASTASALAPAAFETLVKQTSIDEVTATSSETTLTQAVVTPDSLDDRAATCITSQGQSSTSLDAHASVNENAANTVDLVNESVQLWLVTRKRRKRRINGKRGQVERVGLRRETGG